MADSRADIVRGMLLAWVACATTGLAAPAQVRPEDWIIEFQADRTSIDYEAHTLRITRPSIANQQGTMLIRANEAVAHSVELSFNNSEWEFIGDVHIEIDGVVLDAATATGKFKANRLDSALVVGTPAQFSHLLKGSSQRNQGRANSIEFDAARAQVRLVGDAWYSDGRNEIRAPRHTYNLVDRSLESEGLAGDRVRMTIRPEASPPAPKAPGAR
jgi:lipopolysaccharide transport protein LptA